MPFATWSNTPVHHAMMFGDPAVAGLLLLLGAEVMCTSLLLTGKAVSSICTGLGSEKIILDSFIKPSVERVFAHYGIPGACRMEVVSGCDIRLVVSEFSCCS